MRLILFAFFWGCFGSGALANPPAACLPAVATAKLRPIANIGELKAWVQVAPGSATACIQISGCAWRLDESDLLSGPISKFASANVDGICDLRSDSSEVCNDPTLLEHQFGAIAQLVTRSFSNTSTYCTSGQTIVRDFGNVVLSGGGSATSLLTLSVGDYCLNILGNNGSAAIHVTTSCLDAAGLTALNGQLSSEFFVLNDFWLTGGFGGFVFGLPVDVSGATANLQDAPATSGFPTSTYVQSWLSNVYSASMTVGSGNDLDRASDPLPFPSNTEIGAALHWMAAAAARLEPTPFDASTGWSEKQTQNAAARDWMATIEIDDPASFSGTHFRAELARN